MKKKNRTAVYTGIGIITAVTIFLFVASIIAIFFEFIAQNKVMILAITSTILLIFMVFGFVRFTKLRKVLLSKF